MKLVQNTDAEIAQRLLAYNEAVQFNFTRWMINTWPRCQSPEATEACRENLVCEINQHHPAMLARYVAQLPDHHHLDGFVFQREVMPCVETIEALTCGSAIDGLLVMAGLENASLDFIPTMNGWGERFGFKDFEYVVEHGEADVKHADEFAKAVAFEVDYQGVSGEELEKSVALTHVAHFLSQFFG